MPGARVGGRQSPRFPVQLDCELTTVEDNLTGTCRDLGDGGFFFETDLPLHSGTEVSFRLRGDGRVGVQGRAEVVWRRTLPWYLGFGPNGVGVRFLRMDSGDRGKLVRLLSAVTEELDLGGSGRLA